jgi:mRNA interferase MazF
LVDLGKPVGHEMGGTRPALVISSNSLNHGSAGLVIVLPMTKVFKGIPSHVAIQPPEGGIRVPSYIKCEDARSISTARLSVRWGAVSAQTVSRASYLVRLLLDL